MTAVSFNTALLLTLVLALGVLLGYLWGRLSASRRAEDLRGELEAARARLASETQQQAAQLELLERSEAQLRHAFSELANESLRSNSDLFLKIAKESLGRDQAQSVGALREREAAIAELLAPIRIALENTEKQVKHLDQERQHTFATLRAQIEGLAATQVQLSRETRNLVTALRRPEVRGRWGELTLRRVVELAGLSEHCDFTEQAHVAGPEGALRPDLVVHMPDARDIVVDVKTPLDAYLEAIDAPTEELREQALRRHAVQVEQRVRALASKAYWSQFARSPDFAVLFLPGDQFLSSALAQNPELIETALRDNIIIATPSTLIALLKAVAYGWRQTDVARNAEVIRDLGQELHRRLAAFGGHVARVGKGLSGAVDAYNEAVGSLERSVLPQARRFKELGASADAALAEAQPIERLLRTPQTDPRDATTPESNP